MKIGRTAVPVRPPCHVLRVVRGSLTTSLAYGRASHALTAGAVLQTT